MLVLGLDPGTATTGFALVECDDTNHLELVDVGVITTSAGTPPAERLSAIRNDLVSLLENFKPRCAGVETLFFQNNAKTAIAVAQARGVLLETISSHHLPLLEITPLQVKMGLTGYGKADKHQVQEMVKTLLGLKEIPKPDDAADAVAIAIVAAQQYQTEHNVYRIDRLE